jgi:glycosyltransferase involved in cell wall biosynthesis
MSTVGASGRRSLRVAVNAQLVSSDDTYRNAGISRYISTLIKGLASLQTDQQYTIFMNRAAIGSLRDSPISHARHLDLMEPVPWAAGSPLRRVAWEQFALPDVLRVLGADVFHAPANVLPARLPCPSVVTVHDLAFLRYPRFFRRSRRVYQRWFTARSVAAATQVVAVSKSTKRELVELLRVPEQRLHVIYPGIADEFRPVANDTGAQTLARFRARHALPERYLLYLGTLEPRKNLLMLVDAYARLRAQMVDVPPLVLAGATGWYYQPLFARVRALGLERAVVFPGYVTRAEQPLWYAGATVFVYPSLYEGFGLPVAEAMACGTPVITSDASSLPEVAGDVARAVDPGNSGALARVLQEVLADDEARARMAREGPAWAGQFSIARMAAAYSAVYLQTHERAQAIVSGQSE